MIEVFSHRPARLSDAGQTLSVPVYKGGIWDYTNKIVIMVIKTPRGTMALFHHEPYQGYGYVSFPKQTKQCRAIRAFMEEHNER